MVFRRHTKHALKATKVPTQLTLSRLLIIPCSCVIPEIPTTSKQTSILVLLLTTMLRLALILTLVLKITEQNAPFILSTVSGDRHPEPCAFTCTGVATSWENSYYYRGRSYARVDVSGCAFISTPTISFTITCTGKELPDSVSTRRLGEYEFLAYGKKGVIASKAQQNGWILHWSAVGYGCR